MTLSNLLHIEFSTETDGPRTPSPFSQVVRQTKATFMSALRRHLFNHCELLLSTGQPAMWFCRHDQCRLVRVPQDVLSGPRSLALHTTTLAATQVVMGMDVAFSTN